MFGPETDVHSTQITPETDLLKIELLGDLVKKISLLTQRSVYILPKPHMIRTLLRIPLLGDFDKISLLGQRLMYIQPKPHPMLTLLKIASLGQRVMYILPSRSHLMKRLASYG